MSRKLLYWAAMMCLWTLGQAQGQPSEQPLKFSVKVYGGYLNPMEDSKLQIVGGRYVLESSPIGGGAVAWQYNKHWSIALGATINKYRVSMEEGEYPNMEMYRYEMSLGSVWVTPIDLSVRYHINHFKEVNPYAFVGGSYVVFHHVDPGWGAEAVDYANVPAVHGGVGADYVLNERWFLNAEAKFMLTDRSDVNLDFSKYMGWQIKTQLQPHAVTLNLGVGYRF